MASPLIEKFGSQKRWVNWKLEILKDDKQTKIPYFSKGKKASSTDEKTWKTYEESASAFDNGSNGFDGVGIVLYDNTLVCIDIDHVITDGKVRHPQAEKILDLLKTANTFTEISQSGTGLHLFFDVPTGFVPIANKKAPFEIYSNGRYIATTNIPYGKVIPVKTVTQEEMLQILETIGYPWGKDEVKKETQPTTANIAPLEDQELLDKMFHSKNGEEVRSLYNGNISGYEDDASKADMALLAHLAFWTRKDNTQMERIWLASPIGSRKKTQSREDYRVRSIRNAIDKCKEVYTPSETTIAKEVAKDLGLLFVTDAKGNKVFIQNTENISRLLTNHPMFEGRFRIDTFKRIFEVRDYKTGKWRGYTDGDDVQTQTRISVLFPMFGKVSKQMVYDAMLNVARENEIDSAVDFVKSLTWDGEARLDTWLTSAFNTPDDIYHKAVGSNVLKGAVSRILYPGCKFDHVMVLEGEQGIGKSSALSILGDMGNTNWHLETVMSTDSKDFFMQMQGKLFIEFSEGETLSRTEIKRMKAIITTQIDKYRPAYGRTSEDFPRRCIFVMTTNQEEYLKDETGNRRWLPVRCEGQVNFKWLRENRDQLLAEAYHRLTVLNETTHEFPKDETREMQRSRQIADPNTDLVVDWYITQCNMSRKIDGITIQDVYSGAFLGNFSSNGKGMERSKEMSIGVILRDVLGLEKKRTMINGVYKNRYYDTAGKFVTPTDMDILLSKTTPIAEEINNRHG